MSEFVNSIAEAMESALGAPLAVILLSMIPIAEARFAIPFGITMGMNPGEAFGWAFLGSSLAAPILLLTFIPIINALAKTKVFARLGNFLYDKFEKKSKSLDDGNAARENSDVQNVQTAHKKKLSKRDLQKMGGTALFVAIPIPLTGVWTGSAVASIVKLGFIKGLASIVAGNAVACSIITLLCWTLEEYVDYITIAFAAIALCVVVFLIVKFILYKPKNKTAAQNADAKNADGAVVNRESDSDGTTVRVETTKDGEQNKGASEDSTDNRNGSV